MHKWICLPPGTTNFTNFVSPIADPKAFAVDALSLRWEDLELHAFPPVALLGRWSAK